MASTGLLRTIVLMGSLAVALPAAADWMGGFELERGPTAELGHGQLARVTFDFSVDNPDGARFVVNGLFEGAAVPGRVWGGSSTYPAGTVASHTNYISFTGGDVDVDEYQVVMFDPVSSATLLEIRLPVDYHFGPHAVNDIVMSHTSPSWLLTGQDVTLDFAYQTDEPGGVRISARPFTDGSLTPGYSASGIPLSPVGNGSSTQSFTFPAGPVDVDEVRFQVWTDGYTDLLHEFFVPVDLHWGDHGISNIVIDTPSPQCLAWDQWVTVTFDYATSDPGGCLAWARAEPPPGGDFIWQTYTGSFVLPTSGSLTRGFSVQSESGEGEVGFVQLLMRDATNTTEFLEVLVPVSYPFGPNVVNNVTFTPGSPAVLDPGEQVTVAFDYDIGEAGGARIYSTPFTYAEQTQGLAIEPSPVYTGTGSSSKFFRVDAEPRLVNRVGMQIYDDSATTVLTTCFVPCEFTFGGTGGVSATADPPASIGPMLGQNHPNPFNPRTTIVFELPREQTVSLRVYDVGGRLVDTLLDGEPVPSGRNEVVWQGRDARGRPVASGVYFYRLEAGAYGETRRMVLVR